MSKDAAGQLDQLITGYWVSQAIYVAAKFGVADLLAKGPKSIEDLAGATSTNADALYRVLRALASIGIFVESEGRKFSLTPLAEPLQSDVPGSKRALAMMSGDEQFRAWGEVEYSVRTGQKAFDKVFGKPIFDYLSEHPEQAKTFDAAMVGIHGRESNAVLNAYAFSGQETVADIGGGNGSQLAAILKQNPNMQGVLFDLAHVIERARPRIAEAGLSERCQLVSGSFFDAIPTGADVYLMRHIIHDWNDEQCLTILSHCRTAMTANSKLLVIECVIPPGNEPCPGKFLDLVMLLIPGGKERTEEEYRDLFSRAGLRLNRIVPTGAEVSVIEAVRA